MQLIIENEKTANLSSSTHPTSDHLSRCDPSWRPPALQLQVERGVGKLLRSGRGTEPPNPGLGLCQEVLLNGAEPLKGGGVWSVF